MKYIRCENTGENKSLEKDSKRDGLGIQFEWTTPGTPQQTGGVERKFSNLYGRVRATFKEAGLTEEIKMGYGVKVLQRQHFLRILFVNPCNEYQLTNNFTRKNR